MPPRGDPGARGSRGRGGVARGGPPRGGPPGAATRATSSATPTGALPSAHVKAVGVRRSGYGTAGRQINVLANVFSITAPENYIYHYDVISPSEKTLPARLNMMLIRHLQTVDAPDVFTPPAVYDGRKNMFSPRELPFSPSTESQEFDVCLSDQARRGSPGENTSGRGPRVYKIRLTKVATINPEVLQRFILGQQSHDNDVTTALTALNVVVRMEPTMNYPFNVRSFFTDRETKTIGGGLVLWRGYFQSVRPAIGRLLVNVDISTGTMYRPGSLVDLCLEFLGRPGQSASILSPQHGMPERERIRLQRFITGIRIQAIHWEARKAPRVVKKLSNAGASALSFSIRDGPTMTVAQYFQTVLNRPLRYPDIMCVEVGSGALLPLELCTVPPGQIMRKQVPPEKTKDVLDFATKKPQDRLQSIINGLSVLAYGQSEYVRLFGMAVDEAAGPLNVSARVLVPPMLRYGRDSRQPTITPRDGAWNMIDKQFFQPVTIQRWIVVIFERQQRFNAQTAKDLVDGLVSGCSALGITVHDRAPPVSWRSGQGSIADQLRTAGSECVQKNGGPPNLIVVVLPDNGDDIYTAVKHFGDVSVGVATQCLKSSKCFRAKPQYFANVCLKMNVKLGGINTIPDPLSVAVLTDPRNPTIVMGADVIHPAPGSDGRPSFTALVGNVDSNSAKYVATSRVQKSRQEIIEDLKDMAKHVLTLYMGYRKDMEKKADVAPTRLIFFRDGVSEGQFKQVLDEEVDALKAACGELKISPKITFIVVAKRHHIRFFPKDPREGDRSGNCPAGTVVDKVIAHPTEFDWYLQSHGGLLGTSRPAHYNVLHDDNKFNADSLQSLSFALCHVYARSTRSVSIPAPVYYADIVCSRAKNHYDPQGTLDFSDSATQADSSHAEGILETFRKGFKPLHANMARLMYFS
ncbi:argonaute-like protein [Chiua virens]|nr:argonaute-like protein [Chiua virens]